MARRKQSKPTRRKKRAGEPAEQGNPSSNARNEREGQPPSAACGDFPIVGIGASAEGMEALDRFLRHVPDESRIAFVIVHHLDPTHESSMSELLQRATRMEVIQVKDHMLVRPDCVYVIPPNRDMSLLHGTLHLFEPTASRGRRLPIDFFFRSLAEDRQERSIGVILSGMGCDGTLGLRPIKQYAGVVLVQEPSSAQSDSMPRTRHQRRVGRCRSPAGGITRQAH